MENQNQEKKVFPSAEAYIDYLEEKSQVHRRLKKYTLPKSLLDEFDMLEFAKYTRNKDMYTILMNSDPFSEFDSFYNCLDTDRDINRIKTFSFNRSEDIVKKYNELSEISFDVAMSPLNEVYGEVYEELIAPLTEEEKKVESLSKDEWDFYINVSFQYEIEANRIVKVMEKLIKKGKEIVSNVETFSQDDMDIKQVELLILLEEAKDKSNMDAKQMIKTAMNIQIQTQYNVLQGSVLKN